MVNRLAFAGAAPRGWREGEVADPIRTAKSRGSVDRMERDLLSRVTGDGVRQRPQGGQDPRPPPSPTLALRMASAEGPQSRADATARAHCHAPQQAHAPPPGADMATPSATSSRAPFASGWLASVVVPGYPMAERRHNLRAGPGARAQAVGLGQTSAPRTSPSEAPPPRPPSTALVLPTLQQLAGRATAAAGPGQERCGACGLSAELLRDLSCDLDRARAQVALLTCQNESLRSRLKRAAAAEAPAASSARLDLRCGACRVRPATVVLAPREHLCHCGLCSGAAVACPVCRAAVGAAPAPR